jgi:ActR/RegA family two-component response regulator
MRQEALGMQRREKVELFEQIRREYEFGVGTIKGVARKLGVHRRMVRARHWQTRSRRSANGPNASGRWWEH